MSKLNTTEDAAASVKSMFSKLGLAEDGTVVQKGAGQQKELADNFAEAKKEVEKGWQEDKVLDPLDPLDVEEVEEAEPDNKELLKVQAELKVRDEAITKMQKMIDDLSDKTAKQQKAEQQRMLDNIENQRVAAIKAGDVNAVLQLDQQKAQVLGVTNENIDPIYQDFLKRNPWWTGTSAKDIEMRMVADPYDRVLGGMKLTPVQAISMLEEFMQGKFPEYFNKEDRPIVAVEGNVKAGIVKNVKRKYTTDNLSKEAKFIVSEFARIGGVPVDKYVEELNKLEGVKK